MPKDLRRGLADVKDFSITMQNNILHRRDEDDVVATVVLKCTGRKDASLECWREAYENDVDGVNSVAYGSSAPVAVVRVHIEREDVCAVEGLKEVGVEREVLVMHSHSKHGADRMSKEERKYKILDGS